MLFRPKLEKVLVEAGRACGACCVTFVDMIIVDRVDCVCAGNHG
jgi:hypothetical protein